MATSVIEVFSGVIYYRRPVICLNHKGGGRTEISEGMVSPERGLICPICYGAAIASADPGTGDRE